MQMMMNKSEHTNGNGTEDKCGVEPFTETNIVIVESVVNIIAMALHLIGMYLLSKVRHNDIDRNERVFLFGLRYFI